MYRSTALGDGLKSRHKKAITIYAILASSVSVLGQDRQFMAVSSLPAGFCEFATSLTYDNDSLSSGISALQCCMLSFSLTLLHEASLYAGDCVSYLTMVLNFMP